MQFVFIDTLTFLPQPSINFVFSWNFWQFPLRFFYALLKMHIKTGGGKALNVRLNSLYFTVIPLQRVISYTVILNVFVTWFEVILQASPVLACRELGDIGEEGEQQEKRLLEERPQISLIHLPLSLSLCLT